MERLEEALRDYDYIFLIDSNDNLSADGIIGKFMNSHAFRSSTKKILILPAEKYEELVALYHTYEFSDRLKVISKSTQYANLFNYSECGLLTEDEVFELLLG